MDFLEMLYMSFLVRRYGGGKYLRIDGDDNLNSIWGSFVFTDRSHYVTTIL